VVVLRVPSSVPTPALTIAPGTNTLTSQPDGSTVARFTVSGSIAVAEFP
jgi:hypothetical protein